MLTVNVSSGKSVTIRRADLERIMPPQETVHDESKRQRRPSDASIRFVTQQAEDKLAKVERLLQRLEKRNADNAADYIESPDFLDRISDLRRAYDNYLGATVSYLFLDTEMGKTNMANHLAVIERINKFLSKARSLVTH